MAGRLKSANFSKSNCRSKRHSAKDGWRIYSIVVFIFLIVGAIFFRLYTLQILAYGYYTELASNQHKIYESLIPRRGEIFVKDGEGYYPVAVNKELALAFAVPREIEDPRSAAREISAVLELDEEELVKKLGKSDEWYRVIKHKVSNDKVKELKNKEIKGLYFSPESERCYPAGAFASQVLGFVGSDGKESRGRYGIEAYWDKELRGREGRLEQERDTGGRWISISEKKIYPAENGADIYLTLDHTIQYRAEMAIKKSVEKHGADSGSIVIMEPYSGAVLAMASYPAFNPNEFSKVEDMSLFKNPVVSGTYECGSVFKPITMSGGIDSKVVTPDTTYVDTGSVREAGYTIKNSDCKAHGTQTMTQVLEESLNTGAIFVEKLLGNRQFYEYVKNFGFGEKTDIDTIGEVSGDITALKSLKNINAFTASFGQGIAMTPLQLVNAFAVIANGGKLMKPYLVEKLVYDDGSEKVNVPVEKRRVISKEASIDLATMLVSVVENGHGKRAGVPGYLVAGKTGTAQIPRKDGAGYEEGAHIGSFAGFAPAYDPRFVMLVKVDNPKDVEWAESSAAPVFGEMTKFLLDYFGVEPTEEYTQADVDLFNRTHDVSIYSLEKEEEQAQPQPVPEKDNKDKKKKRNKDKKKKKQ